MWELEQTTALCCAFAESHERHVYPTEKQAGFLELVSHSKDKDAKISPARSSHNCHRSKGDIQHHYKGSPLPTDFRHRRIILEENISLGNKQSKQR